MQKSVKQNIVSQKSLVGVVFLEKKRKTHFMSNQTSKSAE